MTTRTFPSPAGRSVAASLVISMFLVSSALAADWPQFQGPGRSGVSPEVGLARTWPAAGPKVLWSVDVGKGFAGAAVRDGQVYLLDRVDDRQDVLRCLDLGTGKSLWEMAYDAPGKLAYNGSRNVPTVGAEHVFTVGPFGHLHCIDRQSHRVLWSHHLINDFKDPEIDRAEKPKTRAEVLARAQVPEWGVTQSPLLYGDLVIVAPQTQKVGLAAYEKATGKLRWTSPYIGRNWYSHVSPTLVRLCGVEQVIMLAQPSDPEKAPQNAPPAIVSSIDPRDGKVLWSTPTPRPYKIPVPSPVQIGEDRLFITGGLGVGCLTMKISHEGGSWSPQWLAPSKVCGTSVHDPVLYKNHLYVSSAAEYGVTSAGLVCLGTDGQVRWQTGRRAQFDLGNLLIADGLILILHGKTGELHLIEANPEGYKLLAKAKVLTAEDGMAWAPMALSDGKLIVRDQVQMKCLDLR